MFSLSPKSYKAFGVRARILKGASARSKQVLLATVHKSTCNYTAPSQLRFGTKGAVTLINFQVIVVEDYELSTVASKYYICPQLIKFPPVSFIAMSRYKCNLLNQEVQQRIREQIYTKTQKISPSYHSSNEIAEGRIDDKK